jgi:hypothetical protein
MSMAAGGFSTFVTGQDKLTELNVGGGVVHAAAVLRNAVPGRAVDVLQGHAAGLRRDELFGRGYNLVSI